MTEIDAPFAVTVLHMIRAINKVEQVHGAPARRALVTFLSSFPSRSHISWGSDWRSIETKILSEIISEALDAEDDLG